MPSRSPPPAESIDEGWKLTLEMIDQVIGIDVDLTGRRVRYTRCYFGYGCKRKNRLREYNLIFVACIMLKSCSPPFELPGTPVVPLPTTYPDRPQVSTHFVAGALYNLSLPL